MLSDAQRFLISAHATGDLPAEKSAAVERLLARSEEARGLHQSLASDGESLRQLPRLNAPKNMQNAIMSRLPAPASVAKPIRRKRSDWWSAIAVAAIVFAVCAGSWWAYQSFQFQHPIDEPIVQNAPATTDLIVGTREKRPITPPALPPDSGSSVVAAPPAVITSPATTPSPIVPAPANDQRVLGSPPKSVFETVQVTPPRLPGAFAIRALDQGDVHPRFQAELSRGDSHRVDIFCRDAGKALERFAATLRRRGVAVQVDALVVEMLKRKARGSFALYCEDLTPAEWTEVFKSIAASDRRYEDLKPGDGAFDQLVLMPVSAADQKDLSSLFGLDPLASQSLAKSDQSRTAKSALALAIQPVKSSPAASKEIKQFLEGRNEKAANTVAAIFYFRLPN